MILELKHVGAILNVYARNCGVRVYRRSLRYSRGLRSGMWYHVTGWIFRDISTPEKWHCYDVSRRWASITQWRGTIFQKRRNTLIKGTDHDCFLIRDTPVVAKVLKSRGNHVNYCIRSSNVISISKLCFSGKECTEQSSSRVCGRVSYTSVFVPEGKSSTFNLFAHTHMHVVSFSIP